MVGLCKRRRRDTKQKDEQHGMFGLLSSRRVERNKVL